MSKIRGHVKSTCRNGGSSAAGDSSKRWFAAYITPRHEKHVSDILTQRRIENFLPLYRTNRQWKRSRPIVLELPLFPTYVFVRIDRRTRGTVLGTPGVLSIVGSSKESWPLSDSEIEALRSGLLGRKIEPHPYLVVGERVRIRSGVMAGTGGILVRRKSDLRIVITLDAIMRSVAVEVDADDVEPVIIPSAGTMHEERENAFPITQSSGWQFGTENMRSLWVPSN